jgi:hypothetical protein
MSIEITFLSVVAVLLIGVLIGLVLYWRDNLTTWYSDSDKAFRLFRGVAVIFLLTLIVWAAGASVMRTIWLYDQAKDSKWLGSGAVIPSVSSLNGVFFMLMQVAKGVGGILGLSLAGGLAGAALGFLFGHPDAPEGKDRAGRWRLNSRLTQISDWLTKAIVGAGLVEAKTALTALSAGGASAAAWLFGSRHGSPVIIPAAVAGGAVLGFIFFYIFSVEVLAPMISRADARTTGAVGSERPIRQRIAPRISRSRSRSGGMTTDQPTAEQIAEARYYDAIDFTELTSRPDVTWQEVWNWARSKAILDKYTEAAMGYLYLVGMRQQ